MLWKLPKALNLACARTFRDGNKMASPCFIIPEYLLKTIIERGNAPNEVVNECWSSLNWNNQLRATRFDQGQRIASAPHELAQEPAGAQGIIPPYIHRAILQRKRNAKRLVTPLCRMLNFVQPEAANVMWNAQSTMLNIDRVSPPTKFSSMKAALLLTRPQIQARIRMNAM